MSTFSVRLPDNIAERLKNLANKHNVSVNKLMNEYRSPYEAQRNTGNMCNIFQVSGT